MTKLFATFADTRRRRRAPHTREIETHTSYRKMKYKRLLSLPPNLVGCFHDITGLSRDDWFCVNDPVGHKLGSGGGTVNLLARYLESRGGSLASGEMPQNGERYLVLHAGGQSRRLPAYAPSGKILTPIPVFRWERGQRLSQDLLQLQLPLYERIMEQAPESLRTMIVSGDVYVRATQPLQPIPEADVVCYGLWLGPEIAKDHGVFVSSREDPSKLEYMLQKPSAETLGNLQKDHYYLTDIGVWMLSDRAMRALIRHSMSGGRMLEYDLYGTFGCALGTRPSMPDQEISSLSVAILPLPGGEFYHFGTSHELLSSALAIQNLVNDQRRIMHHSLKPQPSIFVQNSITEIQFTEKNGNIWVENSYVSRGWRLSRCNIITGVPANDWELYLGEGVCLDIVPVGPTGYCVRRYDYYAKFAGDEQTTPRYPLFSSFEKLDDYMRGGSAVPEHLLSAEEISTEANLYRLFEQRKAYRNRNWLALAKNHEHSVFYQLDLDDAAREFREQHIPEPPELDESAPMLKRMGDAMFRSEISSDQQAKEKYGHAAFSLLREGLTATAMAERQHPRKRVYDDQIVWGRSPVRIDIAGGWTDTPPYCLMEGGSVVNFAIELNGQPPIQTYVKPCAEPKVILRSIDLGASETVETYEQLADYSRVGSPFSIPKAALVLCGFHPDFSGEAFASLSEQLRAFGCGIEVTLLSAIPAGSGLGTSSVLAATVLGALGEFCGLGWDKNEIGHRTLVLEQMLTTGGGWQDQFGGLLHGVKLLQTQPGFEQNPVVRWLPDGIFTQPEFAACHLLYYTGMRRTAKDILAQIVRRMFLNQHDQLALLRRMNEHALEMYDAVQREDFSRMGKLVRKTWQQNQVLDQGTNPPAVAALTALVDDLCLGYKLPGAGGGGYLYMVAKDPEAAARIKMIINDHRPNANARFVDMSLSRHGLQISRS